MPEKTIQPVIKLSPKQVENLHMSKKDIDRAKHELGVMKKLGMDVKMLEEKLTWAEEVSTTLLKEFGS